MAMAMRSRDPGCGTMEYLKGKFSLSRRRMRTLKITTRALLVFIVAMAMLTALPMQAPNAEAARIVITFDDGSEAKIVEFTSDPLPGERATLYLKVR